MEDYYFFAGPDPYGSYEPAYNPNQGVWYDYDDSFSWGDFAEQAINQAARTAQIIGAGYPPNANVTYSPTVNQQQPYCGPQGCGAGPIPVVTAQPPGGIQLSTTTLMLIVGGVLLFSLGKSRR